jgi:hypothetical protein
MLPAIPKPNNFLNAMKRAEPFIIMERAMW